MCSCTSWRKGRGVQGDRTARLGSRKMEARLSPPHKPPGPTLSRPCCRLCSPSPRRSSPDPGCACGREPGSSYAPARELACPPSSLPLAWRPGAPRAQRPPRHTAAGPAARAGKRPRAHSGAPCRQRGGGSPPPPLPLAGFPRPAEAGNRAPWEPLPAHLPLGRPQTNKYLQTSRKRTNKTRPPAAPARRRGPGRSPACCPLPSGPAGLGAAAAGPRAAQRLPPAAPSGLSPVTTGRSREPGGGVRALTGKRTK